jgi:hypothetical protein
MTPFVPKRLEHVAFGLLLSGFMSFLVSGLSGVVVAGISISACGCALREAHPWPHRQAGLR